MIREKKFVDVLNMTMKSKNSSEKDRDKRRNTINLGIDNIMRKDLLYDIGRKEAEEKIKKHYQKI